MRNILSGKNPPWVYLVLALAPALPIAALTGWLAANGQADMTLTTVWCLWAAAFGLLYLRRLDETARAAQRWAWEWGGAFGLGAAIALAVAGWDVVPGLAAAFESHVAQRSAYPAATGFAYGAGFAALLAMTGWLVALVIWWLPKRGNSQ